MRKTLATGIFVTLGLSAVGVGAIDNNLTMVGSDTLRAITRDLLTDGGPTDPDFCSAASPDGNPDALPGLNYIGTGSTAGENACLSAGPTQGTCPMSRALNRNSTAVCGHAQVAEAEGIVFALDGLSVIGSQANTANCDLAPAGGDDCDKTTDATRGLNYSKQINVTERNGVAGLQCDGCTAGSFTFGDWREILRVLYFGLENADGATRTNRDCNSDLRRSIVAQWDNVFQNNCGAQGCPNGLRHVFRRDEESGTTDVFVSLLGGPGINFLASPTATPAETGESNNLATSPFCNVRHPQDANPPVTVGGNAIPRLRTGRNVIETAPYWPEYQDQDPVRVAAQGTGTGSNTPNVPTEQVASADGTLGLLLPITIPPLADTAPAKAFPIDQCSPGEFRFTAAPPISGFLATACPNGDNPFFGTMCSQPVRVSGGVADCACLNGRGSTIVTHLPTFILEPGLATAVDGRVYNLHLHERIPGAAETAEPLCRYLTQPRPRQGAGGQVFQGAIVGAFYRIHSSRTLNTPADANPCRELTSTLQLGCVTRASPCSISFAGREGADIAGVRSISIDALPPTDQCVGNLVANPPLPNNTYRIARRLYLNSIRGFEDSTVANQEFGLARCFAQMSNATVIEHNFIPMPSVTPPGGGPAYTKYCEDFRQETCTPAQPAGVDACQNNTGAFDLGIPADDPTKP
jgi:hypothetical protein